MATITESVEVRVPAGEAYDRWTRFEEFPRFMQGVEEVRRLDDRRMHWRADVAGRTEEWDAEVIAADEGRRIAWRSVNGLDNGGDVRFEPLDDAATRVTVNMHYEPEGPVERAGEALGLASRRVRGDLERFRELAESERGRAAGDGPILAEETGSWTGDDAEIGPEDYPTGTRLPSLSRLRGSDVYDQHGERIGSVSDVYLDSGAEYVRYIEVKTGWGPRGRGLVPVDAVTVEDDGQKHPYVRVPYVKDQIRLAPGLDDGDELTPEREEAIYSHYERTGYWDRARKAIEARQTVPAPTPEIAEAEVIAAVRRGGDPESVRVKRWGV